MAAALYNVFRSLQLQQARCEIAVGWSTAYRHCPHECYKTWPAAQTNTLRRAVEGLGDYGFAFALFPAIYLALFLIRCAEAACWDSLGVGHGQHGHSPVCCTAAPAPNPSQRSSRTRG